MLLRTALKRLLAVCAFGCSMVALRGDEPVICGVGIVLTQSQHGAEIREVLEDSPAGEAGLLPGFIVTRIDGVETARKTLDKSAELIRGTAGSEVILELTLPKTESRVEVTLIRAPIRLKTANAQQVRPLPVKPKIQLGTLRSDLDVPDPEQSLPSPESIARRTSTVR